MSRKNMRCGTGVIFSSILRRSIETHDFLDLLRRERWTERSKPEQPSLRFLLGFLDVLRDIALKEDRMKIKHNNKRINTNNVQNVYNQKVVKNLISRNWNPTNKRIVLNWGVIFYRKRKSYLRKKTLKQHGNLRTKGLVDVELRSPLKNFSTYSNSTL